MPALPITNEHVDAVNTGLTVLYQDSYAEYEPVELEQFATNAEISTLKEVYDWLGSPDRVREWKGNREKTSLNQFDWTVTNLPYELTISMAWRDYKYDRLNQLRDRIADGGRNAKAFPAILLRELERDGAAATSLCYDGKVFFATDHEEKASGAQSNLLTGTGTSLSQLETDLTAAVVAIRRFKDDKGNPFWQSIPSSGSLKKKYTISCPPELEIPFEKLAGGLTISADGDNIWTGRFDIRVNEELTDTNDWHLYDLTHRVKPYVFQWVMLPSGMIFPADMLYELQHDGEVDAISTGECAASYLQWRCAVKTTNT